LVGVGKFYLSKVIRELDDVIKGNMSREISCGCRGDSAVFVFMIEIEVLLEFLFFDLITVHDLKEFLKLFDEVVIISRFLEFSGQVIKSSMSGFDNRISRIHNTQQILLASNQCKRRHRDLKRGKLDTPR
jgi:hypothetical protein